MTDLSKKIDSFFDVAVRQHKKPYRLFVEYDDKLDFLTIECYECDEKHSTHPDHIGNVICDLNSIVKHSEPKKFKGTPQQVEMVENVEKFFHIDTQYQIEIALCDSENPYENISFECSMWKDSKSESDVYKIRSDKIASLVKSIMIAVKNTTTPEEFEKQIGKVE